MKSKNTITEFKCYMDLEREIAYINKMNAKGWKLVYIKWGCFYTFTKAEPGEYVTILHFEEKENISGVAAFAAQCGYENIPHTMDGLGETLYLTGRKAEVSEDFVNDNQAKAAAYRRILKKYTALTIVFFIIGLLLIAETAFMVGTYVSFAAAQGIDASDIPFIIIFAFFILFTAAYTVVGGFVTAATVRLKKKINGFKNDSEIYE